MNNSMVLERIIGCVFNISKSSGTNFINKEYKNILFHELKRNKLKVDSWESITATSDGDNLFAGGHLETLLVENEILIEVKTCARLDEAHLCQCTNYLRAMGLTLCLLVNFTARGVQIKRINFEPESSEIFISGWDFYMQ